MNLTIQQLLERNRVFKDRHKGKRCFVIGNGPSLATQDISPLSDEITFVMSAFWKHPVVDKWQPTYYCFADPLFFDGSEIMQEFFRSLRNHIHNSTFFVPLDAAKVVQEQGLLPLERTYYVPFRGALSNTRITYLDFADTVPCAQSVSQLDIMAAMYMGCSPIYLLGLDHDWLSHLGPDRHFYEGLAGMEKHPDVRPTLADFTYKYCMECQLGLWYGYERLLEFANKQKVRIFNATNGGFLDVFERVNYASIFVSLVPENSMEGDEIFQAYLSKIIYMRNKGWLGEVQSWILRAMNRYPDSSVLKNIQAELKIQQGNLEEAKGILEDIVRKDSTYSKAFYNLGFIYWKAGDLPNALKCLLHAVKTDPYDKNIILNAGQILERMGKLEEAKTIYSSYLYKNSDDKEIGQALSEIEKSINKNLTQKRNHISLRAEQNYVVYWGDFSTWEEARSASEGYDAEIILNKVKDALLKVKTGEAAYERDSVLFDRIQYSWLWSLLEGLLQIALRNNHQLSVLDFGGSLGSTYFAVKDFLSSGIDKLKWSIVEQKHFVDCGRVYFEDEQLKFYYDIETCKVKENPDVILLSGVIQYIQKPYDLIEDIISNDFKYIIFDRTAFIPGDKDRLTVEKVPPVIYDASYPAWFLGIDKFLSLFNKKFELITQFDALDGANIPGSFYKGFIFYNKKLGVL